MKHDLSSKQGERFMNLFYDLLNNNNLYKNSQIEQVLNLIYNLILEDFSLQRQLSFIKRISIHIIH